MSVVGAASTLLAMNPAYARAGRSSGFFDVPKDAARDLQLARSSMDGKEFIFDVQGHFVNPTGAWLKHLPPSARPFAGMAGDARYVEMTPKLRAKIFGLNALKIYPIEPEVVKRHVRQDKVARRREEYRASPDPAFVTYGPKSPAQHVALPNRGG